MDKKNTFIVSSVIHSSKMCFIKATTRNVHFRVDFGEAPWTKVVASPGMKTAFGSDWRKDTTYLATM